MLTVLEKSDIIQLVGKALGIVLEEKDVTINLEPLTLIIHDRDIAKKITTVSVVKENPTLPVSTVVEVGPPERRKALRRPVLSDEPLTLSQLVNPHEHIPRDNTPARPPIKSFDAGALRPLGTYEVLDISPTTSDGKEI
jgi:hypothetical protein